MIGSLISLFSVGLGMWRDSRKAKAEMKREEQKGKHELRMAELQNKTRLMSDMHSNNHSWEMKALTETGKFLKWASFAQFSIPIFATMVAPYCGLDATEMWKALDGVPVWWQQCYIGMNGTIWGVMQLRDMGVGGITNLFHKAPKQTKKVDPQTNPTDYVKNLVSDFMETK